MNRPLHAASVSHTEATLAELRNDPEFAVEYLRAAIAELEHPEHHVVGILALHDVVEAYGDVVPGPR